MHAPQRIIAKMESVNSIRGGEVKIVEGFVYIKKHNLAGWWCAFECKTRRYCNGAAGQWYS